MKNIAKNNAFKSLCLCLGILLLSANGWAQSNLKSQTIEKEFSGKSIVELIHSNGPIKVHPSMSNSVRMVARMDVEGTSPEDIEKVFNQFKVDIDEFGEQVRLNTKLQVQSWESNNRRTKIKFRDGTKVTKIKSIKIYVDLYIPQLKELRLENKYDNIYLSDVNSALDIRLYSGQLESGNITGSLALHLKYSKARIGVIQDGDLDIYDSKLQIKGAQNLKLKSKYSDGKIGPSQSLRLRTYDDDFEFGDVAGDIELQDKYSEFEFGSFTNGDMDIYDANIIMSKVKKLDITSKYSEYAIEAIDELDFSYSYDDDWRIRELGNMSGESKYTEFKIAVCHKGLRLTTYDDNIIVRKVSNTFDHLELSGKYTEMDFPIPNDVAYHLTANLTHGKLHFPENRFDSQYYKEKSSKLEIRGQTKGAGTDSPKVAFELYDCKVDIE